MKGDEAGISLASRAGQYSEHAPLAALSSHFRCVWTNRIPDGLSDKVAVVPDGCVDLLWRDGRFIAVGPDITAAHIYLSPGTTVLGLRFQAGAAADWLGLPMSDIVGAEIDMRDIWGQKARDISEMLLHATGPGEQAVQLQDQLAGMMPAIRPTAGEAARIFGRLQDNDETNRISTLMEDLGMSERTLRRRSHHLFGYGPKTLDRILRFQRFQTRAMRAAETGLADMALAAGYADQAHLGREIQALCGMTAGTFLRRIAG